MSVDIYTTPGAGTHNFPSAGTAVVEIWGGGQGGENGSSIPNESGDGGAGGSYSKRTFSVTSTGYSYYVGDGGAASAPPSGGDVGEDSWFESDTLQLAKGGGAGSGNIGDVTYTGGAGGARAAVKAGGKGGGGGSSGGSAANGNAGQSGASGGAGGSAPTDGGAGGNGGNSAGAGSAGSQPGGGGGGGGNGATSGGAGAAGKIVVTFTADPEPPDEPPGPPPPPEPPPPEPPPPDDTTEDPPRKLIIRDKTGRLPKNPKNWPAGLKAAVAGCCGCDESSSSSSGPRYGLSCCGGSLVYDAFCVTISGGSAYDGTYNLTFQTNQLLVQSHNLFCAQSQTFGNGWFSDWVEDCRKDCPIVPRLDVPAPATRHRIYLEPTLIDGVASCYIRHVTESKSVTCLGRLEVVNGVLFNPITQIITMSCDPLTIIYRSQAGLPSCACSGAAVGPIDAVLTGCE